MGGHDGPGSDAVLPSKEKSRISSLPEFQAHAAENSWRSRRDRGLPWKQDVFEFVRDVYAPWIERGQREGRPLTQADIKAVDKPLWEKFQQESSKRGVPEWLTLPRERRSITEGVTDPAELERLMTVREYERKRSRRRLDRE